jgi:hypothetical protein
MACTGLPAGRTEEAARLKSPMKGPDCDVVWGDGLGMPDKYARAIPQLEAFEKCLRSQKAHEPLSSPRHPRLSQVLRRPQYGRRA